MGERNLFQPLTREDKITVVLYRTGIAMSALAVSSAAYMLSAGLLQRPGMLFNYACLSLYFSRMSVFFIHLYVSKFHRRSRIILFSRRAPALYYKDFMQAFKKPVQSNIAYTAFRMPRFYTAKEAFCFRLNEGYLLPL